MNNKNKITGKVSDGLKQIKNKYPQMVQKFEEIKKDIYKPQIERLGNTKEEIEKEVKEKTERDYIETFFN